MDRATALYSCDDHLDLRAVPRNLWEERLPKALRERGPRAIAKDGAFVWVCDDRMMGGSGRPANDVLLKNLSAIGRAGIDDDGGFRAGNAKLRLEDMDLDGLWASVVYGPVALGFPISDPSLQSAVYTAWNDWAVEEFNAVAPDRLCVLAFLPDHSPEAAAAELERCASVGHRGAIIDVFGVDLGDPAWDRLWAAADHTGLPVSFHIKAGTSSKLSYEMGKWKSAAFATLLPLQLDEPLATMIFSGALERHPGMKLVLAEAGVGWLPYFLTRMDMEWRALRDKIDYAPSVPPSELFHGQVFATFEEEEMAAEFIPHLGAESCMWASDDPHTDSTFPDSRRAVDEALGSLSAEDRRKITAAFYRSLGLVVIETSYLVQVYVGAQMINFHQPSLWQQESFTLRAPAATPPCGDLCFVWGGSAEALKATLDGARAEIIEGPVPREGGRQAAGTSVYVRDPAGNLLEFIIYDEEGERAG